MKDESGKINHKGAEGARRKEESALDVSFVRLCGP
jgi:hypothetical protein